MEYVLYCNLSLNSDIPAIWRKDRAELVRIGPFPVFEMSSWFLLVGTNVVGGRTFGVNAHLH